MGLHEPHRVVANEEPVDRATHQLPLARSRAAMSVRPSPLKSPLMMLTQIMLGSKAPQSELLKEEPVETPVQSWPFSPSRPSTATGSVTVAVVVAVAELP